jgi:tetratricopeptide (TPR) repeat protein
MGKHRQVLAESAALLDQMAGLPPGRGENERIHPPLVRELVHNARYFAALAEQDWQQALDLSTAIQADLRQRGESPGRIAEMRFNDATPLMALGRLAEADEVLAECQEKFEEEANLGRLSALFATRALAENQRGRAREALGLLQTALRLGYSCENPDPRPLGGMHYDLALNLQAAGADPAQQWAHQLAGVLIHRLAGITDTPAMNLRLLDDNPPPAQLDDYLRQPLASLVELAERTEGVRLRALLAALQPDPVAVEAAYAGVCRAFTMMVLGYSARKRVQSVVGAVAARFRGRKQ